MSSRRPYKAIDGNAQVLGTVYARNKQEALAAARKQWGWTVVLVERVKVNLG